MNNHRVFLRLPQPPFAGLFALEPMETDDLMPVSLSSYAMRAEDGTYQLVVVFGGIKTLEDASGLAEIIVEVLAEDQDSTIH